ncbi:hypothetical protein Ahy_B01g056230 [Arachis hypogaea]|uniref:Uncharacterized protein n=1 Tax=Arachis hypogaea TaxID=3818 RepID=A0A445AYH2_ARAHY|nr:hypothetical protein Ahy_B01g056230 [Arachis hypogaea]
MKKCFFFFNTHENALSLRISLKITQTSITFSVETTTVKESEEDFASNNHKQTKTATKTTKAKHNKKMATMKEKAHYNMSNKGISTVYRKMSQGEMSQEKKDIVEEMEFGALANVPEMNVSNTLMKELLDRFDEEKRCLKTLQGKIYITLQKVAAAISITNAGNRFPEKCFLLPTTVSVASPIHKLPIFHVDNIQEWNWAKHVLNFLMKGVENKRKEKK